MLTRKQVLKLLKEHGWEPQNLTAFDKNHRAIAGTSFDDEIGVKLYYTKTEVLNWLGY